MEIFPAIDIKGGQVVRLTQGDYDRVDVYSGDPAETAAGFLKKGARNLHMVDLDGARDGTAANFDAVRRVVERGGLFTQLGGGIRNEERIEKYLKLGVNRLILGTMAVEDFAFLQRMVERYGERIAVGVDARGGRIAVRGWRELTDVEPLSLCKKLESAGVRTIIYTDISRDGMGQGTNLDAYRALAGEVGCDIIASGGVTHLDEIAELREIGTYGVIVGKALYTGALKLEEVLAAC